MKKYFEKSKKMTLQKLMSQTRQALDDYHMICEGETIAVGISGGKDSLALLQTLNGLKRYYSPTFQLIAVTVDVGFKNINFDAIKQMCEEMNIPYYVISTEIYQIVFKERNESNPCSLCSKMRKGAINQFLTENHISKLAYAHHKDDVIETMMLSLLFEGRFHTFSPVTYLSQTNITLIRPFIYVNEADIIGYMNRNKMPVIKSACPADGNTKREYIKQLIKEMNCTSKDVKKKLFTAVVNSDVDGWKKEKNNESESK